MATAHTLLTAALMANNGEVTHYALADWAGLEPVPDMTGPAYVSNGELHYNATVSLAEQAAQVCACVALACHPDDDRARRGLETALLRQCLWSLDLSAWTFEPGSVL